ncbi:MAG: precorrin-8X methylmutase [Lachnospiraceae bacterium]
MEQTQPWEQLLPGEIEGRSFEIITKELGERTFPLEEADIIKRVIHTSADFEYADTLTFSPGAVEVALQALKNGADIVTDTQMVKAGIHKASLQKTGGTVHCFIADEDVAREAKQRQTTRSAISMEKAATLPKDLIIAVGNAPTALLRLAELIEEGTIAPKLIIGVPVGFVNVVLSKERIMQTHIPYIVAKGRKGGSNIAAAICNGLLYKIDKNREGIEGLADGK